MDGRLISTHCDQATLLYNECANYTLKITTTSPRGQWVKESQGHYRILYPINYAHGRVASPLLGPVHYNGVIMTTIASQIPSLAVVYLTVYSDVDQRKHQSSALLAFVWGIHRGPLNSPHKGPVTRKMFPFDDVIMRYWGQSCNAKGWTKK